MAVSIPEIMSASFKTDPCAATCNRSRPTLAVNQENLFHRIKHAARHQNLTERLAGNDGFHAPLNRPERNALLDDLIQGFREIANRRPDRSPDGRPDDGINGVGQLPRILADGV